MATLCTIKVKAGGKAVTIEVYPACLQVTPEGEDSSTAIDVHISEPFVGKVVWAAGTDVIEVEPECPHPTPAPPPPPSLGEASVIEEYADDTMELDPGDEQG